MSDRSITRRAFEAMLALAGPTVDCEFRASASPPVGRAMLENDPRRHLNAFLCDRDRLRSMPEGSMHYMGGAGILEEVHPDGFPTRGRWLDAIEWRINGE